MRELGLVLSGAAAGVMAGMGLGGGTLLIPMLTLLAVGQRAAQGINMLSFLPAAALALWIHKKEGRLDMRRSLPMLLSGMAGAALGAFLAYRVNELWLKRGFGALLVALAVAELVKTAETRKIDTK